MWLGQGTLGADGTATIALAAKSLKRGSYRLTASYRGSDDVAASSARFTVTVTNPAGK